MYFMPFWNKLGVYLGHHPFMIGGGGLLQDGHIFQGHLIFLACGQIYCARIV